MASGLRLDGVGASGRRLAVRGSGDIMLLLREVQKRGLNPKSPTLLGLSGTEKVLGHCLYQSLFF